MKKMIFLSVLVVFSSALYADASVEKTGKINSYLLTAPGTISGTVNRSNPEPVYQPAQPSIPGAGNLYVQPQPQQFVQDNYNFPQYGQLRAQPNPWLDQPPMQQRNREWYGNGQQFDNPWDITNLPSLAPNGYQNKPVPGSSLREPAYGFYGDNYGDSSFYPQFSNPLDRNIGDPSSAAGFPYMNGLMPGLGKDNGGFPFMPFGLF